MSEEGWEARMAQRATQRRIAESGNQYGMFARWLQPGDPEEIMPEVLAARCLGIAYGDPGPRLPAGFCRQCWGDRHIWLGNTWGREHQPPGWGGCQHACHKEEVWFAHASGDQVVYPYGVTQRTCIPNRAVPPPAPRESTQMV